MPVFILFSYRPSISDLTTDVQTRDTVNMGANTISVLIFCFGSRAAKFYYKICRRLFSGRSLFTTTRRCVYIIFTACVYSPNRVSSKVTRTDIMSYISDCASHSVMLMSPLLSKRSVP